MNDLKMAISHHAVVQRIRELENYIDHNEVLNDKLLRLKNKQKQMVNAKEYHQPLQYKTYKKEYDEIYQELLDLPFVEEYLELLDEANQILLNITNYIEEKINKALD